MWAAISVLQIMSYITLMGISVPAIFSIFLECVETVHNFNKMLPNPFAVLLPSSQLNMTSHSEQFYDRGFSTSQMLYLCGSDITMLAIMSTIIVLLIPLSEKGRIFETTLNKLRYSSLNRTFIQAYLKICLAACVNIEVVIFLFNRCSSDSIFSFNTFPAIMIY